MSEYDDLIPPSYQHEIIIEARMMQDEINTLRGQLAQSQADLKEAVEALRKISRNSTRIEKAEIAIEALAKLRNRNV